MNPRLLALIKDATTKRLERIERMAAERMKSGHKVWGDIWLVVEGELIAREWADK